MNQKNTIKHQRRKVCYTESVSSKEKNRTDTYALDTQIQINYFFRVKMIFIIFPFNHILLQTQSTKQHLCFNNIT